MSAESFMQVGKILSTINILRQLAHVDEKILGDEGMPPTGETYCNKDTVNGQIRLMCEVTNRYHNGQLKEKGQRIIIKDKATKEGKWEYYTETGTLDKTVNYINDIPVH